jgi:hypothetical protein
MVDDKFKINTKRNMESKLEEESVLEEKSNEGKERGVLKR